MKRKVLIAFAAILMTGMLVGTGNNNQVKAGPKGEISVGQLCMYATGTCKWDDGFRQTGIFV